MRYSQRLKRFYNDQYYYKDKEFRPSIRHKYWNAMSHRGVPSKTLPGKDPLSIIQARFRWIKRVQRMEMRDGDRLAVIQDHRGGLHYSELGQGSSKNKKEMKRGCVTMQ